MMNLFYNKGKQNKRNKDFQLWDQYNHPVELSTNEMMEQRLDYTHYNPVVAGFVESPEDWIWSSARDYFGTGTGKIPVKFIE